MGNQAAQKILNFAHPVMCARRALAMGYTGNPDRSRTNQDAEVSLSRNKYFHSNMSIFTLHRTYRSKNRNEEYADLKLSWVFINLQYHRKVNKAGTEIIKQLITESN